MVNVALQHCQPDPVGAGRRCTLMKGFLESRSSAAFQVSRRALSNATAMSASLNWGSLDMFNVLSSRGQTWDTLFGLRLASTMIRDSRGFLFWPNRGPTSDARTAQASLPALPEACWWGRRMPCVSARSRRRSPARPERCRAPGLRCRFVHCPGFAAEIAHQEAWLKNHQGQMLEVPTLSLTLFSRTFPGHF